MISNCSFVSSTHAADFYLYFKCFVKVPAAFEARVHLLNVLSTPYPIPFLPHLHYFLDQQEVFFICVIFAGSESGCDPARLPKHTEQS